MIRPMIKQVTQNASSNQPLYFSLSVISFVFALEVSSLIKLINKSKTLLQSIGAIHTIIKKLIKEFIKLKYFLNNNIYLTNNFILYNRILLILLINEDMAVP
jgi:hypothetical protein